MKDEDALFGFVMALVLAALVIYGYILWAIVWFIISAIIGYIKYQRYLKNAQEDFDETAQELGVDLPVDDILHSIGIEPPEEGGFETVAEWMAGTPFGVTEQWEAN